MKKLRRWLTAGLLAILGMSTAQATDLQFDYLMLEADLEDVQDFDPDAVQIKLINPVGPNTDVVGVFALGISDDELEEFVPPFGTISLSVDLSTLLGIYVRAHADIGNGAQLFAQFGFVKIDYELDADIFGLTGSESFDEAGLAFGFGLSLSISDRSAFVVEYNQYPDVDIEDASEISSTALSLGYRTSF